VCSEPEPAVDRATLSRWLSDAIGRIDDPDWARGFQEACPIPSVDWPAYQHRLLLEEGGPTLLAGIRFKGGDRERPFVDLLAWDQPLSTAADWRAVRQRLARDFAPFAPRVLRVCVPGDATPPVAESEREVDQRLVGGSLETLRSLPRPPVPPGVVFEVARTLDFVESFHASFARWQEGAGPRGQEVYAASRDELETCLSTGLVVCALHQGRWAGVMAVYEAQGQRLPGTVVCELFLDASLQGRGCAPALQRSLIEHLDAPGATVLFGTIHGTNEPSLRTALRCGRRVVETWWFVTL